MSSLALFKCLGQLQLYLVQFTVCFVRLNVVFVISYLTKLKKQLLSQKATDTSA